MSQGIIYPQGCRPVTEELGADELIRRLKVSYSLENEFVIFLRYKL